MDLRHVSRSVQEQLAASAAVGDEPTRRAAQLMSVSLDPALRLAMQEVVGQVAAEITAEIAPGRVDLWLRGGELEIQVVPPSATGAAGPTGPAGPAGPDGPDAPPAPGVPPHPGTPPAPGAPPAPPAPEEGETAASRVTFRPPQHLKTRLEQAAESEGLSMNAYLVRALTAHLDHPPQPDPSANPRHSSPYGTGRTSGWYI